MNLLNRIETVRSKEDRLVLGMSSGTSADGVDVALVRIQGNGTSTAVSPVAGSTFPFDAPLQQAILALSELTAAEICRMNFTLGEFFADSALHLIAEAGFRNEDVDLIGSHGQTIYHIPRRRGGQSATLQIGEPDVIAERTGVPVIADFRTRDVAAGGEGAPLIPYVDYLLFRSDGGARALQNIGGIANVSVVTDDLDDTIAFDTGPGNMPLDSIVRVLTRGQEAYDRQGKHAAKGRVDENLLDKLLRHAYFDLEPPKSTGRETFGDDYVMSILRSKGNDSILDVLATMTVLVARSIHQAYERFIFPKAEIREVILSGGGAKNLALLSHLRKLFHPVPLTNVAEYGYDPDLKEAVAFAVLANETLFGNPNNVPAATGANWPVVLGKISP